MSEPMYCLTARNRLTGDMEIITPPCTRAQAIDVKLKFIMGRNKKAYIYPKVEIYAPQTQIKF